MCTWMIPMFKIRNENQAIFQGRSTLRLHGSSGCSRPHQTLGKGGYIVKSLQKERTGLARFRVFFLSLPLSLYLYIIWPHRLSERILCNSKESHNQSVRKTSQRGNLRDPKGICSFCDFSYFILQRGGVHVGHRRS